MAYCGPRGIELDAFLRWSQASQDAALEWALEEARRCRDCGTHHEEWDVRRGVHPFHAHAELCPGQKVLQDLASSPQMQEAGHGVRAVLASGPAADCPRCNPSTGSNPRRS